MVRKMYLIIFILLYVTVSCSNKKDNTPAAKEKVNTSISAEKKSGIRTETSPVKTNAVNIGKKKRLLIPAGAGLEKPDKPPVKNNSLKLKRSTVCGGIKDREPVSSRFIFKKFDRAYYFTEILNGKPGRYVYHIWSHENGFVNKIKLKVTYYRHRTWSNKNLALTGRWFVETVDENGVTLDKKMITVNP